ncbi:MAG: hypothetical protein I8H71_01465 [Xanthomonadaceae bacterium]|nr:hypothetical protein [Xanthomonadaceae bacterium]
MADAQTPALTDEDGLPIGFAKAYNRAFAGQSVDNKRLAACEEMWLAAQAPAQPGRAVMQQALDALEALLSMQAEWHAAFPEHVGDKEAPAMQAARAAIAALSATMEKS